MKKGEKKRQKKALAKRAEAKHEKAQRVVPGSAEKEAIMHARSYPIYGCWTHPQWQDGGLAVVVVARQQPNGELIVGSYVVDYYCLGVKDCLAHAYTPVNELTRHLAPRMIGSERPRPISAELAHELVYGSIEYAARWGFHPHPDFALARMVLDPPDVHPRSGTVEFGKDGKPLFISGPYDDAHAIVRQLARTAGQGQYDYMVILDELPEGVSDEAVSIDDLIIEDAPPEVAPPPKRRFRLPWQH